VFVVYCLFIDQPLCITFLYHSIVLIYTSFYNCYINIVPLIYKVTAMKQDDTIMSEGEPSNYESTVDNEGLQPSLDVDDGLNTSLSGKCCF